ncbi:hypothetical protein EAF00_007319 [Botryotinia globosa]|nr:hypothetical protein EAF00_007319 [Botryotinia globosa]
MLSTIALSLLSAGPMAAALALGLTLEYSLALPTQELLADNTTVMYPDVYWNSYNANHPSSDPSLQFVSIDGARIGPDGRYWLVDGGSSGINGSTTLVGCSLTTDTVDKIYYLDSIIISNSGIDDVRFSASGEVAYLSDTAGALVVLNMTTGDRVRVLVDDPSAVAYFPMMYNHTLVPGYGAAGLYRIETAYVDAALTNATMAASLGDLTEPFALTPSTGGSTIDGDGNVYVSDTNLLAIWKVTPEGHASILVQDDALIWTDLIWVTSDKKLLLLASQMRRGGNGLMAEGPNNIFSYPIDAGPSPIDDA